MQDEKSCGCRKETGVQRSKNEPPFFSLPAIQTRRERLEEVVRRGIGARIPYHWLAGAGYKRTLPAAPGDGSFIGSTCIYLDS